MISCFSPAGLANGGQHSGDNGGWPPPGAGQRLVGAITLPSGPLQEGRALHYVQVSVAAQRVCSAVKEHPCARR